MRLVIEFGATGDYHVRREEWGDAFVRFDAKLSCVMGDLAGNYAESRHTLDAFIFDHPQILLFDGSGYSAYVNISNIDLTGRVMSVESLLCVIQEIINLSPGCILILGDMNMCPHEDYADKAVYKIQCKMFIAKGDRVGVLRSAIRHHFIDQALEGL